MYIYMHIYTYIYLYLYLHLYLCVYISSTYTYIYKCIHRYIHTHLHITCIHIRYRVPCYVSVMAVARSEYLRQQANDKPTDPNQVVSTSPASKHSMLGKMKGICHESMYVYIYIYIHTHVYRYIHVCIYIYVYLLSCLFIGCGG